MWTEYIPTENKLEYMLFPRLAAVAEVGWTKPENKDYADFTTNRLPRFLKNIGLLGVNYRIPEANIVAGTDAATGRRKLTLTTFVADSKIYYTIDGHKADTNANLYTGDILLPTDTTRPLSLRYIIVAPGNKTSGEYTFDIK